MRVFYDFLLKWVDVDMVRLSRVNESIQSDIDPFLGLKKKLRESRRLLVMKSDI
jgi:hypothetical protein